MAIKKKSTEELLQDLLILELAKAGVPQPEIRKMMGIDIHRVNRIARYFNKFSKKKYDG